MEVFRINIKPRSEIEKHEAFRKSLHHCPLCDQSLDLELQAGPAEGQVVESAFCPACEVQIRSETHSVH